MGNPFIEMLGIEFIHFKPRLSEAKLKVEYKHLNPWNNLHGGVFAALADTVMGAAVRATGKLAVTVNLVLNYLQPVKEGEEILCQGKVIYEGKNIIHAEAVMTVESRLVGRATGVFYVVGEAPVSLIPKLSVRQK
ncbi:MAG: PaaI family thioesterase [Moorellaceae bacterium]